MVNILSTSHSVVKGHHIPANNGINFNNNNASLHGSSMNSGNLVTDSCPSRAQYPQCTTALFSQCHHCGHNLHGNGQFPRFNFEHAQSRKCSNKIGIDEPDLIQSKGLQKFPVPMKRKQYECTEHFERQKVQKVINKDNNEDEAGHLPSGIRGSGNLVVTEPQNCTFNIYRTDDCSSQEEIDKQSLEWAGVKHEEIEEPQTSKILDGFAKLAENLERFVDCKS